MIAFSRTSGKRGILKLLMGLTRISGSRADAKLLMEIEGLDSTGFDGQISIGAVPPIKTRDKSQYTALTGSILRQVALLQASKSSSLKCEGFASIISSPIAQSDREMICHSLGALL